jgi:AIPR protein
LIYFGFSFLRLKVQNIFYTFFGNRFTIRDYQIVNGCQTSHVLYNCKNFGGIDNLQVTVKIIVTDKDDVINSIIKATNHQTPVKKEELEALSAFQKKLEQYYDSYEYSDAGERLYYERRSKQYQDR